MKLLKKYLILELIAFILIMIAAVGCESDECKACSDCLIMSDERTYCESDFKSITEFNETIEELELGGCTCD